MKILKLYDCCYCQQICHKTRKKYGRQKIVKIVNELWKQWFRPSAVLSCQNCLWRKRNCGLHVVHSEKAAAPSCPSLSAVLRFLSQRELLLLVGDKKLKFEKHFLSGGGFVEQETASCPTCLSSFTVREITHHAMEGVPKRAEILKKYTRWKQKKKGFLRASWANSRQSLQIYIHLSTVYLMDCIMNAAKPPFLSTLSFNKTSFRAWVKISLGLSFAASHRASVDSWRSCGLYLLIDEFQIFRWKLLFLTWVSQFGKQWGWTNWGQVATVKKCFICTPIQRETTTRMCYTTTIEKHVLKIN